MELYNLITAGREGRNLEYKQSMSWNDPSTKANITRAILAMSNIRDGGAIVLGVEERSDGTFEPIGMNPADADTFDYDEVASYVAEYADPYVQFSLDRVEYEGKIFIVIQVKEFEEVPVICKKSGKNLCRGKIYTRTRRMPESAEVSSQSEMREIIDMAVEKGIRRLLQLFSRIGLTPPTPASAPIDDELFNKQIEELL